MKGICPLCKKPNNCAVVKGEDPSKCWCMSKKVPEDLLKNLAPEFRGKACVCEACLDDFTKKI